MNAIRRRMKRQVIAVLRRNSLLTPALDARALVRRTAREVRASYRESKVRRQLEPLLGDHGPVLVRSGRGCRLAKRTATARLIDVMQENLHAALDLLEEADVDYFLVPIENPSRLRIGVSYDDYTQVVAAALAMPDIPPHRYLKPSRSRVGEELPFAAVDSKRWESLAMSSTAWTMFHCYASDDGNGLIADDCGCEIEFWRAIHPMVADHGANDEATDPSVSTRATAAEGVVDLEANDAPNAHRQEGEHPRPEDVPNGSQERELVDGVMIDAVEDEPTDDLLVGVGERVLRARRRNPVSHAFAPDQATRDTVEIRDRKVATYREFAVYFNHRTPRFPIDVVYTWVDDTDQAWQQRRGAAVGNTGPTSVDAVGPERYANRDELLYSLRSLHQYADFARHVYLVTDAQVPPWLADSPDLTVVDHRDIFVDVSALPVFNSHAIESQLHHIDGLSEHYLYVNDDVLFARRVTPDLFFTNCGDSLFFPSKARVPMGPATHEEPAVTSAGKNGRDLVAASLLYPVVHKFKHTPHAQRRSVLAEMERRFPGQFAGVAASKFRSHSDISIAASLHHNYAHATGRAMPGRLRYQYVNLAADRLPERLGKLMGGRFDTLCLNDIDVDPEHAATVSATLLDFLRSAFPYVCPFEIVPPTGTDPASARLD